MLRFLGIAHNFVKPNRCMEDNTHGNFSNLRVAVVIIKASYVEVCVCVTGYFVYQKRCFWG